MSKRRLRILLVLSVMVSMAMGMLPVSGGHWDSHSPLAPALAQARLAMEIEEHGHVHDDMEEQARGHAHGHNPADHTHEIPNVPAYLSLTVLALGQSWQGRSPSIPFREAAYRLERPPRPILPA